MTRRLTIDLPIPPAPLWPNGRAHYMAKARAVKRYRGVCHLAALAAANQAYWGAPAKTAMLEATFYLPARKRDPDNCIAALKAAIDGVADAGIIINDRDVRILPPTVLARVEWRESIPKELRSLCSQIGTTKHAPRVRLEITAE
jgi:crossover junction endodeoxyribonuclease RusA